MHHNNHSNGGGGGSEDMMYNALETAHTAATRQSYGIHKFYESDVDTENESLIFNPSVRGGQGHARFDSVGSNNTYHNQLDGNVQHHAQLTHSNAHHLEQQQQQPADEFDQHHHHKYSSNQRDSSHQSGNNNNHSLLPYQKRKQLLEGEQTENYYQKQHQPQQQQQQMSKMNQQLHHHHLKANNNNDFNNHENEEEHFRNKRPSELSTIGTPFPNHTQLPSPPRYFSNQYPTSSNNNGNSNHHPLPPIQPPKRFLNRLQSDSLNYNSSPQSEFDSPDNMFSQRKHINGSSNQQQHQPPLHPKHSLPRSLQRNNNINSGRSNYNDESPRHQVPTLHIRTDSTGSMSSLGSITGGASSISRWKDQLPSEGRLGHDNDYMHADFDGNHNGNNDQYGAIGKVGSGFLSSILGSISMTSAGSVQSLDDEKADFHKKNQKFLKKAEKNKAKEMKRFGSFDNGSAIISDIGAAVRRK